jgi:hypothetical protein
VLEADPEERYEEEDQEEMFKRNPMMILSGYLPLQEVASLAGRDQATINRWIHDGRMKGVKDGTFWYVQLLSIVDHYKDEENPVMVATFQKMLDEVEAGKLPGNTNWAGKVRPACAARVEGVVCENLATYRATKVHGPMCDEHYAHMERLHKHVQADRASRRSVSAGADAGADAEDS